MRLDKFTLKDFLIIKPPTIRPSVIFRTAYRVAASFKKGPVAKRQLSTQIAALIEAVLNHRSSRKIDRNFRVTNLLGELYSYHRQRTQALLPRDFSPRLKFCKWFLEKIVHHQYIGEVLYTDECNCEFSLR